jgi:orotidine-5'-phosphate decarboxylase
LIWPHPPSAEADGGAPKAAGTLCWFSRNRPYQLDEAELHGIGVLRTPEEQVAGLVALGRQFGLRGVVCSPREIAPLRAKFGDSLTIVTPGVRPAGSASDDQQRVMTPAEAIRAGADHLVIGRPITAAKSPREAALRLADEIEGIVPKSE